MNVNSNVSLAVVAVVLSLALLIVWREVGAVKSNVRALQQQEQASRARLAAPSPPLPPPPPAQVQVKLEPGTECADDLPALEDDDDDDDDGGGVEEIVPAPRR